MSKFYKITDKQESLQKVYCTIDGVLTPVVYKELTSSYKTGAEYSSYNDLKITGQKRLIAQSSLKNASPIQGIITEEVETTTTTPQAGTVITNTKIKISPICVFEFSHKVFDENGSISKWVSSFGSSSLSQSTSGKQPSLGFYGKGINGSAPLRFDAANTDFMSFDSAITLTGDFTLFFYVEPLKYEGTMKRQRLLGKSDNDNMFLSIGELANESHRLSFSSSNKVQVANTPKYWSPYQPVKEDKNKVLISVVRDGTKLIIRENGLEVASEVVSTADFTFDQMGKVSDVESDGYTMHASMYHFSAWNGAIVSGLDNIEASILKRIKQAKSI